MTRFISENLPELRSGFQPEGTYLLWIDCNKLHLSEEELHERLLEKRENCRRKRLKNTVPHMEKVLSA